MRCAHVAGDDADGVLVVAVVDHDENPMRSSGRAPTGPAGRRPDPRGLFERLLVYEDGDEAREAVLEVAAPQRDPPFGARRARPGQPGLAQQAQVVGAGRGRQARGLADLAACRARGRRRARARARAAAGRRRCAGSSPGRARRWRGGGSHGRGLAWRCVDDMLQQYFHMFGNMARAMTRTRRLGPPPTAAYALGGRRDRPRAVRVGHPDAAVRHLPAEWHFSTFVLTLVYAVYPLGVLAALLTVGRISDELGRRPVLVAGARRADRRHRCCSPRRLGRLAVRRPRTCRASPPAWRWAPPARRCSTCTRARRPKAGLVNGVVSAARPRHGRARRRSAGPVRARPADDAVPRAPRPAGASRSPVRSPCPSRSPARPGALPPLAAAPPREPRAAVRAGRARRARVVVGRRRVPRPRPGAGRRPAAQRQPPRRRRRRARARRCRPRSPSSPLTGSTRAARRPSGALALAVGMALTVASLSTGSAALFLAASVVTGAGFGVAFLGALRSLTAVDPGDTPSRGDVGVLRRRLRLAGRAGDRRGHRRLRRWACSRRSGSSPAPWPLSRSPSRSPRPARGLSASRRAWTRPCPARGTRRPAWPRGSRSPAGPDSPR